MDKLEIYVHIPFCVKKCDYCDFLSMCADSKTKKLYIEALKKEIRMSYYNFKGYEVDSIFIGGGTPSILEGYQIKEILNEIRENANVSKDAEITIECNPGTVSYEKMKHYKEAGINRISFGLQSANDEELQKIGRIHTYEDFLESYNCARECGFDNINIDIMSALPEQTLENYRDTVNKVINLQPEHISAYSLIVEEETPLAKRVEEAENQGVNILPAEETEREMYYMTKEILEKNGYERYEVSNYSKKGYECRHNIGYWKRKEYIGVGVGAASLFKGERYNNVDDIYVYINSLHFEENISENENFFAMYDEPDEDTEKEGMNLRLNNIRVNKEKLTVNDEMEEFMFLGLRMIKGISTSKFEETFGKTYDSVYGKVTENLVSKKLIDRQGDNIRLTDKGIDVSNMVLAEFLI